MRKVMSSGLMAMMIIVTPVLIAMPMTAAHAIIVFDPSNYAQNLLAAARALEQIDNQIHSLQNEATMLANQARNLTTVSFPELQQITADLQRIDQLMGQAQSISFDIRTLDAEFTKLFPGPIARGKSLDQRVTEAQARVTSAMAAYEQTMGIQAQVVANVRADATMLSSLSARSQAADGALQVAQTTNQLLALTAKQQFQIQQLMAAQYRAQALDQARREQSAIDAAASTKTFLGTGTAYTPQ